MPARSSDRSRPGLLVAGVGAVAVSLLLGMIVGAAHPAMDDAWLGVMSRTRTAATVAAAELLHVVGAGWFALGTIALVMLTLLLWRRWWAAGFVAVCASVSPVAVELMKNSLGRARPEAMLVDAGFGSYPSGHSARAVMLAVAIGIVLPRVWVVLAGCAHAAAMMMSRTVLEVHWLSDTVGGALVGAGVTLIVASVLAAPLRLEAARPHLPPWRR